MTRRTAIKEPCIGRQRQHCNVNPGSFHPRLFTWTSANRDLPFVRLSTRKGDPALWAAPEPNGSISGISWRSRLGSVGVGSGDGVVKRPCLRLYLCVQNMAAGKVTGKVQEN